jgi:NitT/TauT family transport system substrate-binding protein
MTPEVMAKGLGGIESARFENSIEQMALANEFKAKPKAADIFDGSFLPPAADRMAE